MDSGKDVYTKDNPRVMHLGLIFAALFVFLVGALGYRQLYMHDYYMKRSDRQSLRRVIKAAARGDILDRNSTILVTNKPRYSAVIYFNDINEGLADTRRTPRRPGARRKIARSSAAVGRACQGVCSQEIYRHGKRHFGDKLPVFGEGF